MSLRKTIIDEFTNAFVDAGSKTLSEIVCFIIFRTFLNVAIVKYNGRTIWYNMQHERSRVVVMLRGNAIFHR